MKKTIGFIALLLAFSFTTIAQVDTEKRVKAEKEAGKMIKQVQDKGSQKDKEIKGKVSQTDKEIKAAKKDAKAKKKEGLSGIKDAKKQTIINQKEGKEAIKKVSKETKEKYVSMKKEEVDALPITQRAEAKKVIIEKKVNTSDMKSASAQMKIAGIKTRLKKGLEDGSISEADYKIKMEKVAKAEASLKEYRTAIKGGKSVIK